MKYERTYVQFVKTFEIKYKNNDLIIASSVLLTVKRRLIKFYSTKTARTFYNTK